MGFPLIGSVKCPPYCTEEDLYGATIDNLLTIPFLKYLGDFIISASYRSEKEEIDILLLTLKDSNFKVREKAAMYLSDINDTRVIEPLIMALRDKEGIVPEHAASTLKKITKQDFGKDSIK